MKFKNLQIHLIAIFAIAGGFTLHAQNYQLEMVKDINPNGHSWPYGMTEYNGKLYFEAYEANSGYELWVTDGTTSGTTIVKDINPNGSSSPSRFTLYNNKLYFRADDGTNGNELWQTDGTGTGTILFKDINTSPSVNNGSSDPYAFTVYNNHLYFRAFNSTNGTELWVTDGTTAGTIMLKDINPGNSSGVSAIYIDYAEYNGKLYFAADDGTNGRELWVTDGTSNGTQMLKDINPNGGSDAGGFTEYNGKLYFYASNGTNGRELWVTDGTSSGTQMLKDINPNGNAYPGYFTVYNNELYFSADGGDQQVGRGLWKTDGTTSGTVLVSSLDFQGGAHNPQDLIVFNGILYFSAGDEYDGQELWRSNGTLSGTYQVKNINTANYQGSDPKYFHKYNGRLYFTAIDGTNGRELWQTDGTSTGTVKIQPAIATVNNPLEIVPFFTELNGSLYFSANFDSNGHELWKLTTQNLSTETVEHKNILKAYPNPVNNILNLSSQETINNVLIVDMLGKTVFQNNFNTNELNIDISNLQEGIYFVQVSSGKQMQTIKIIKK